MDTFDGVFEQFRVSGKELSAKVRELIHQGNVRRIIVRDDRGHTFMEIPLTVAGIEAIAAPVLAAVAAMATLVSNFDILLERAAPTGTEPQSAVTDASVGATEDKVNMAGTVPEHVDKKGTKLEDIAGTGQHDSLGG